MKKLFTLILICLGLVQPVVFAADLYVVKENLNPVSPYTNRANAARTIQAAVDAASNGDTIWVAAETYDLTDQITVSNSVTIQSENGPDVTIIDAQQNGRCFELAASGAVLSGLTIQNGEVTGLNGGGVYCSSSAVITNCIVTTSIADEGGGIYGGTCYDSVISWNLAWKGGGVMGGSVSDCVISNNYASGAGGGAHSTTLKRCIIKSNEAVSQGGGVYSGSTESCLIIKNKHTGSLPYDTCGGGGTFGTENRNSTICDNSAFAYGSGVHVGFSNAEIHNSIVCFNTGPYGNTYGYSQIGDNVIDSPGFMDRTNGDYRLAEGSKCIDAGNDSYADETSTDLDGLPRIINEYVDVGAYEYTHGPLIETSVESFTFSARTGDASFSTNFTVRNIGSGTLVYTNSSEAVPGVSVSPTNGLGLSTGETNIITLTVYPSNLTAGAHSGNIVITGNFVNSPQLILVTLTIQPGTLAVSTDTITLETPFGTSPTNRSFTVHNSGTTGVINYVVSDNADWLLVSPTNDTCSTGTNTVDISFATDQLEVGSHTGTVSVTSSDVDNSPQEVAVYLEVTSPSIGLSPAIITLQISQGTSPTSRTFFVYNSDSTERMDYEMAVSTNWLSVSPTNGICNGTTNDIPISFITTNLLQGSYTGIVSVVSTNADNSPQEVTVYLEVIAPSINLSPGLIVAQGTPQESPAEQSFAISNISNSGAMDYTVTVSNAVSWLEVSPSSGTVANAPPPAFPVEETIMVSFDTSALSVGSYTGTIFVAALNADNSPQEIQVLLTVRAGIIYVCQDGNDTFSGYSWAEAKATIQGGVDAVEVTGGAVLVSNGTYYVTSEILIDSPLTLRSLSGPDETAIDGMENTRCLYLENQSIIVNGFTIQNGFDWEDGGGVYCDGTLPLLTNCLIFANAAWKLGGGVFNGTLNSCVVASNSSWTSNGGGLYGGSALNSLFKENNAVNGGGVCEGTASGCLFENNSAVTDGGGTYNCDLKNCTVANNSAGASGGGMYEGDALNSIVYYNAPDDLTTSGTVIYCCSPGLTNNFPGNIINDPVFVHTATGAYQLDASSPCIDNGRNAFASWPFDLIGSPRIHNNTVDMGAYEYYVDLTVDSDADGMSDADEILAGTDPNDPNSVLRILSLSSGLLLTWQGGTTVQQVVDAATDLTLGDWLSIYTNLAPTAITNNWIDDDTTQTQRFYRIRVGP